MEFFLTKTLVRESDCSRAMLGCHLNHSQVLMSHTKKLLFLSNRSCNFDKWILVSEVDYTITHPPLLCWLNRKRSSTRLQNLFCSNNSSHNDLKTILVASRIRTSLPTKDSIQLLHSNLLLFASCCHKSNCLASNPLCIPTKRDLSC